MKSSQDYKSVLYSYFWYWCNSISLNHHRKQNLLCCLCGLLATSFFPHLFLISDLIIYFAVFVFTTTAPSVSTPPSILYLHSIFPNVLSHLMQSWAEVPRGVPVQFPKFTALFQIRIPSPVLPPSLLPPDKHFFSLYSTIQLSLT